MIAGGAVSGVDPNSPESQVYSLLYTASPSLVGPIFQEFFKIEIKSNFSVFA